MRLKNGTLFSLLILLAMSTVACGKFAPKEPRPAESEIIMDDGFDDGNAGGTDVADGDNGGADEQTQDSQPQSEPAPLPAPQPPSDPKQKPAANDNTPIAARWNSRTQEGAQWTRETLEGLALLGRDLIKQVPRDMAIYCPTYANLTPLQRASVWVMLISAVAEKESSFNPKCSFTEGFKDGSGKLVVSRGLLQISSASANAYGCGIKHETDLENPKTNLTCGVRILNTQIGRSHVVSAKVKSARGSIGWRGGASYWAVLRNNPKHRWIQQQVRSLAVCKP